MENEIYIIDENGIEKKMIILLTYESNGKEYVLVHEEENDENVFAFSYDSEGNLFPVEDPQEAEMAAEILSAFESEDDHHA